MGGQQRPSGEGVISRFAALTSAYIAYILEPLRHLVRITTQRHCVKQQLSDSTQPEAGADGQRATAKKK